MMKGATVIEHDGPRVVIEFDRDTVRADELILKP